MKLTIDQIRRRRELNDGFEGLCYVVYNTVTGKLDSIFLMGNDAWKYAYNNPELYAVNIANSIHCPRDIYLQLTPYAQLDMFKDGYLEDDITDRHKMLRRQILVREGKETTCLNPENVVL
jgi:hypothetical protein